ncbi:MAG: hypothetical protein JWR72_1163 [Flavisolibacter sp.]|jgi:general stress protein 26|nr:hypothetical protein [Flavisolibacter sp.]
MAPTQQLNFIQERIEEIGSAIFYNLSASVLKLPNTIVTSLQVDDYGFVWFCVQKSTQNIQEFEQEFPVKLDFYKKGVGYFLQVEGKAFVVSDPEEMNAYVTLPDEIKNLANNTVALVKVKIQKADYYVTKTSGKTSWWQSAVSTITTWFRNNNHYRAGNTFYPAS